MSEAVVVSLIVESYRVFKHFLDDSSRLEKILGSLTIIGMFSLKAISALGFSASLL